VDGIVKMEKRSRSELIQEAMCTYLEEKKRQKFRETMIRGYREMGEINLELAEEGIILENEGLRLVRARLAECE